MFERVALASPLITVVSWRVGTRPALSVVSAAAAIYERASSEPSAALIDISKCFGAEKSRRGFVYPTAVAAAVIDFAASTDSTASAFVTVLSTSSPSVVVGSSASSVDSETSSASVAATRSTRAASNAGLCVSATPTSCAWLTTIVPSSLYANSVASASTLNPSRSPSIASTSASLPADVWLILKVAFMPDASALMSMLRPIGRAESCSRLSLTDAG